MASIFKALSISLNDEEVMDVLSGYEHLDFYSDIPKFEGRTPLMVALELERSDGLIKEFINKTKDFSKVSSSGHSPLLFALTNKYKEGIISLLLDKTPPFSGDGFPLEIFYIAAQVDASELPPRLLMRMLEKMSINDDQREKLKLAFPKESWIVDASVDKSSLEGAVLMPITRKSGGRI